MICYYFDTNEFICNFHLILPWVIQSEKITIKCRKNYFVKRIMEYNKYTDVNGISFYLWTYKYFSGATFITRRRNIVIPNKRKKYIIWKHNADHLPTCLCP